MSIISDLGGAAVVARAIGKHTGSGCTRMRVWNWHKADDYPHWVRPILAIIAHEQGVELPAGFLPDGVGVVIARKEEA
jgi:hypothetical protein